MSVFPNGYNMVPNGMSYTLQPQYGGTNYGGMPLQQVQPVMQMQQPVVQPQQVQVQQQAMVIGGKMVDAVEVAKAADIPMDGNTYYFPKADGSEIYTKRWTQNCTTEFVTYRRDDSQDSSPVQTPQVLKEDIVGMQQGLYERLDFILDRVSKLEEAFK